MARGRRQPEKQERHGADRSSRYELVERTWEPRDPLLGGRRSRRGFAYRAYVPEPIAAWDPTITSSIGAVLAQAEDACAELNRDPPTLASTDALARQLLRAEAVASSRIEGFSMSHRRLARAQAVPGHNLLADQIVGNIKAMERAVALTSTLERVRTGDVCAIHGTLREGTRDEKIAGQLRTRQNWIGGEGSSPANAEFIPPPWEDVGRLMDDLCVFLARDDLSPALQAAIVHAQFETIHPFEDGNGRVGRALIHVVLRRRGVAPSFVPPISLALAAAASQYVKGLTSFRYGDAEDWFEVFANALALASRRSSQFAADVERLKQAWRERAGNPRRGSTPLRLIEELPGHPVISTRDVARLLGVSGEAARLALNRLEAAGVIQERSAGRAGRVWESVGLFALLDAFERDLGPSERAPTSTN